MINIIKKEEVFSIVGLCMEVHNNLGGGFLEIVYKDALQFEFEQSDLFYEREKQYEVNYKGVVLPHYFYADFVVFDSIILEVKSVKQITNEHIAQVINYLKVSGNEVAILVNFGESKLTYKRIVLTSK